jgi:putative ABC transport system ATP-binding protein
MSLNESAVLEIQDLVQTFGDRKILDLKHWSVTPGAHCLIEGQSGSGKSTLLHLIAGLMRPSAGLIAIERQPLSRLSGRALDELRGKKIGIVLQSFHLIEALDVLGNLKLAQSLAGNRPNTEQIMHLLSIVGIDQLAGRKPRALSQGERQRVAIVRAIINRPALLLADEPTSALDDRHADAVLNLLIEQADEAGATLLMATHDARAKASLPVGLSLGAGP